MRTMAVVTLWWGNTIQAQRHLRAPWARLRVSEAMGLPCDEEFEVRRGWGGAWRVEHEGAREVLGPDQRYERELAPGVRLEVEAVEDGSLPLWRSVACWVEAPVCAAVATVAAMVALGAVFGEAPPEPRLQDSWVGGCSCYVKLLTDADKATEIPLEYEPLPLGPEGLPVMTSARISLEELLSRRPSHEPPPCDEEEPSPELVEAWVERCGRRVGPSVRLSWWIEAGGGRPTRLEAVHVVPHEEWTACLMEQVWRQRFEGRRRCRMGAVVAGSGAE